AVGRQLTTVEACLLIDEAATAIVAGNIRRSAGMRQFSEHDEVAALLRTPHYNAERNKQILVFGISTMLRRRNLFGMRWEWIELDWQTPRSISEVQILFDSSLHFHFWQSWQGYPVNAIPSVVRDYRIVATHRDGSSSVVVEIAGNHQRNRRHPVALEDVCRLRVEIIQTHGHSRAQVYSIRAFSTPQT
ncbi:MAG: hypothetical protein ACO3JG_15040, partial [Luteolibacter sp.]